MSKIERNKTFFQLIDSSLMIPDYQRDYAQGRLNDQKIEDTRINFIRDIISASLHERSTHMGLVFGSNNKGLNGFVAVDGQQRLTTCFLFHLYLTKRLGENTNELLFTRLKNFGWNGRIYASEFTEFLFDSEWNLDSPVKEPNISQLFRKSKDYFTVWEQDPTVNNMLVVLDEIHRQLKNVSDLDLNKIKHNLISDTCNLNFDYMKLEEGTDEFQYQKMNSRGRDLTTYELFKQKFFNFYNISEAIKNKFDNEWLLFFDKLSSNHLTESTENILMEDSEPDIFFQNYINETALWMGLKYLGDTFQENVTQIENSKIKGNRTDVGFVKFETYNILYDYLNDFEKLIDWYIVNYRYVENILSLFWYNGERTRLLNIFKTADYQSRAMNYSIYHYAKQTAFANLDEENFRIWWRPVHNLIANSDIDRSNFSNVINAIDNLPVYNLLTFLKDNSLTGFSEYQREEEKRKAQICLNNPEMIELFNKAEKRNRFRGQIAILIPDDNELSASEWENIVEIYNDLAGDRYINRGSSDFEFIASMLTFAGEDAKHDMVNGLKLKYEWGHLRGGKIPARWIHRMIFKFKEIKDSDFKLTPSDFFQTTIKQWRQDYDKLSFEQQKQNYWIKYIVDNYEECKVLFKDSDYGKLNYKDGNLWLYLKTNKQDRDILLSNRRKDIIEKFPSQYKGYITKHDVVKFYDDLPDIKIVFASNNIWVGISQESNLKIQGEIPPEIFSDNWHKAWQWFPWDKSSNFMEKEGENSQDYVERILQDIRSFCVEFVKKLNLYQEN